MDEQSLIKAELDQADQARSRGNEGRARVCARRAAGFAAREYLARRGQQIRTKSAYDALNLLIEDGSLSDDLRRTASYLTMRVDEEFKLPAEVDLVALARKFCASLLADKG